MKRRVAGMLEARLPELKLEQVVDPRARRGRRWELAALLRAMVVGLVTGRRSLAEVEALTAEMSVTMRPVLRVVRRVPDTTARDVLCALDPDDVRRPLHAQIRAAHRRKALAPEGLPFGVVAMDGKGTAIEVADDEYAQRQPHSSGDGECGVVRTVTACLVSTRARPCIDVVPIHASTNEMGQFESALSRLCVAYEGLRLFQLVTYDAGVCSEHNARVVIEHGLDYLLAIKGTQPTLLAEIERALGRRTPAEADAHSEDVVGVHTVVRRVYVTDELSGWLDWQHLRTVVRVESETLDRDGKRVEHFNRYFGSSLPSARLSASQWLRVVRAHWGVENNCHHTWDAVLQEDEHPWIQRCPRATVVVMVLRRIAYNLLTLFRSVTQRSDDRRQMPWRDLLRAIYITLIAATDDTLGRHRDPEQLITD
ncbi:MAG TPA: ISAs1 family transposase [Thermoleophilia bacterium]|nr:ISAs1 family transposase [Thermoleophilia bacterium]